MGNAIAILCVALALAVGVLWFSDFFFNGALGWRAYNGVSQTVEVGFGNGELYLTWETPPRSVSFPCISLFGDRLYCQSRNVSDTLNEARSTYGAAIGLLLIWPAVRLVGRLAGRRRERKLARSRGFPVTPDPPSPKAT